ncbi:membrane protein [Chelonobacter oris]|uniref:Membrane protein n=1 Tax=Chelonobacter oris TaxID=505317 RepID=A0A0A3APV2_9PAST|nr:porin [Chelonobacter oris]KGQ69787.1 membrane protein [Chelonobacter oris]
MFKLNHISKTLLAATFTLSGGYASAAAFQLVEVSTSGLGRAYAGDAAIAENASVVAVNPALMTQFKRPEISVGAIYIDPDVNLKGTIHTPRGDVNADQKNIAPNAIIPNIYYIHPLNDRVAVGGGINVNYGLMTEFPDSYNAGFYAGKTDLTAINFNLSGAYRLNDNWSFGLGLNAVYADALIERNLGINSQNFPQLNLSNSTTAARLEGKEWGYGWNAGVVYEFNEDNRIGVAYHSHVDIDFKGDYSNQLPLVFNNIPQLVDLRATNGAVIPGQLTLKLPSYWEVAGYHKLTGKFAVHYSYKWTRWSRFQSLQATDSDGQTLFHKAEKFKDASRIALGVSYDVNDKLTLRTGIAYDETPVPENYFSISIPDADRTWYSVGATYQFTPNLSMDIAFTHLKASKNTFREQEPNKLPATFTASSTANLYGLALNYRF